MGEALIACRAVHFAAALLVFGAATFPLYVGHGIGGALPDLDRRLRQLLLAAAIVALLSALALVPCVAAEMAGPAAAAADRHTIAAVLWHTGFGRVWSLHLAFSACLVIACAVRPVPSAGRAALAALALASLGLVGHPAAALGPAAIGREANAAVHLLAGGMWLGGLARLWLLARKASRSPDDSAAAVLRLAVGRFSLMAYGAVALVAASGMVNTWVLVGGIEALLSTAYGRLLMIKIALFLLLLAVAAINRLILVPWIAGPGTGRGGAAALSWTVASELGLGLGLVVVVAILGTLPPGMHMHAH